MVESWRLSKAAGDRPWPRWSLEFQRGGKETSYTQFILVFKINQRKGKITKWSQEWAQQNPGRHLIYSHLLWASPTLSYLLQSWDHMKGTMFTRSFIIKRHQLLRSNVAHHFKHTISFLWVFFSKFLCVMMNILNNMLRKKPILSLALVPLSTLSINL